MTRRTLIAGAPALLLHRALKAQKPAIHQPPMTRYRIPDNPVARWNCHTAENGLSEGATVSAIPDMAGNGNNLSVGSGSPMVTCTPLNGRRGYWAGASAPGSPTPNTPACAPTGYFVSPNITLQENQMSVLFCACFGNNGEPNGNAMLLSAGNTNLFHRGGNAQWPKPLGGSIVRVDTAVTPSSGLSISVARYAEPS